jgi:menaquinone-dependent protoporphyrinogen IX oxidase
MKTLIVYGTRYGATAETSEQIAKSLRGENFDVKVVNLKEEKIEEKQEEIKIEEIIKETKEKDRASLGPFRTT